MVYASIDLPLIALWFMLLLASICLSRTQPSLLQVKQFYILGHFLDMASSRRESDLSEMPQNLAGLHLIPS